MAMTLGVFVVTGAYEHGWDFYADLAADKRH